MFDFENDQRSTPGCRRRVARNKTRVLVQRARRSLTLPQRAHVQEVSALAAFNGLSQSNRFRASTMEPGTKPRQLRLNCSYPARVCVCVPCLWLKSLILVTRTDKIHTSFLSIPGCDWFNKISARGRTCRYPSVRPPQLECGADREPTPSVHRFLLSLH